MVCILSTEPAFALVKKQSCKHSNTLVGFKGKFRELQVSKPGWANWLKLQQIGSVDTSYSDKELDDFSRGKPHFLIYYSSLKNQKTTIDNLILFILRSLSTCLLARNLNQTWSKRNIQRD